MSEWTATQAHARTPSYSAHHATDPSPSTSSSSSPHSQHQHSPSLHHNHHHQYQNHYNSNTQYMAALAQQQLQQRYTPRRQVLTQPNVGLQLHHPSPVRAHSYPLTYAYALSLSAASSSSSQHHLPSPPLSTTAMPDPWGADRHDEDDDWGHNHATANGLPSPRVVPLPSTAPIAYPLTKRTPVAKRVPVPAPYALEVWASLMDLSKGRDKVLKTVQYSMRTYLYVLSLIKAVRPLTVWFRANEKRTKLATAGLSLTRKCLLLLNPLRPVGALLSPEPTSAREFLNHLIDLIGALADDIFCLSKLGLVSRKKGVVADRWANRIWFLNTVTGLYGQYLRSARVRDAAEENEDDWKTRKLICDLVFVSYDIFNLTWFREPVLCAAGLSAAFIGTGQLYNKEYKALAKRQMIV